MKQLEIIKNTFTVGMPHPITFLHVTDSHLTFDDPESPRNRARFFETEKGQAADYFLQAMDYADKTGLFVVNTGDLIDYFSKANFDFVDNYYRDRKNAIYAAGNHDFCHWVGRAKEDYDYKWDSMKVVAPHFRDNLYFDSRLVDGVNFVTLDNSYYLMTEGQKEALEAEVAKGYPIVLCMHVPLFQKDLADLVMEKNPCAYVVAAPDSYLANYPDDRRRQQTPDKATLDMVDYIKTESAIKALVVGHTHRNSVGKLDSGLLQIATTGSFDGCIREITLV